MVYVPAANTLQVELRGSQFGKEIENVLYFNRSVAITPTEVENLFDFLEDEFLPGMAALQVSTMSWDEIYGTDLTTDSSPVYTRVISPAITGAAGGAGVPNNNALCVSFRTNNRGRSSRGRNYVAGLGEGQVAGDDWDLSTIDAFVALYELLLGGGDFPATWDWVVVSRFLEGLPRVAALVQTITDVLSTDIEVDSQRRRVK